VTHDLEVASGEPLFGNPPEQARPVRPRQLVNGPGTLERDVMSKPKILVCVLCSMERGGWLNPFPTQNLLTMSHDDCDKQT